MFERTRQGAVDIVSGREPLNHDNVEALGRAVAEPLGRGQPRVVLDMAQIPFIDSIGLEWLLETQERCRKRGGALKLSGPNALCRDILRITGLDEQFEMFDEPVRAVGSFAQ